MSSSTGFRPHQRPALGSHQSAPEHEEPQAPRIEENLTPAQQSITAVSEDVLDRVHRGLNEEKQATVSKAGFEAAGDAATRIELKGNVLSAHGHDFEVSAEHARAITLLEPQRQIMRAVADTVKSGRPAMISVADGVDAGAAARWYLEAAGVAHRHASITRLTSPDALAGSLRPDGGKLRVTHGPLTDCVMNGGVFIADGIEQADENVLAILTALAKGVKEFHHPISNDIIAVHPDFRLVLVTSNSAPRYADDLTGACAPAEARGYTADDHVRMLTERCGVSTQLASALASIHDSVKEAQLTGKLDKHIDFGRGFPVAWQMLERVASRLASLSDPQPGDISNAFWAVYGARLTSSASADTFRKLLKRAKLPEPVVAATPAPNFTPLGNQAEAWSLMVDAHRAGEAILVNGPGQSGVTALVKKLGEQFSQDVVTVMCGPGTDPQTLIERPVFMEDYDHVNNRPTVKIEFIPGVVADALLKGKIVYFDHFDHLPADRQEALMRLAERKTFPAIIDGKTVEQDVHPSARIVFSATTGAHRTRHAPPARERSLVTEVRLGLPSLADALATIPEGTPNELRARLEAVATELYNESPANGVLKLLRFRNYVSAATLMQPYMSVDQAVGMAARLFFDDGKSKSRVLAALPEAPEGTPPTWMQILGLAPEQVKERVADTGYALVPSMSNYLLPLALAAKIGCAVDVSGPPAAGKTVLGTIFGSLLGKPVTRVNVSAGTESADLFGGVGPVVTDAGVRFLEIAGPAWQAIRARGLLSVDEWNLSGDAAQALKSLLDRGAIIDPNVGSEEAIGSSMLFFSRNPIGTRGRQEQSPVIEDAMMRLFVRAKPVEERADIVAQQCGLDRAWKTSVAGMAPGASYDPVLSVAKFFEDLDVVWQQHREKIGGVHGPISCTERDMLKVARRVDYLIKRDNITDPTERRKILGREAFRLMRGLTKTEAGAQFIYDTLITKHFGADVPRITRPEPPRIVDVVVDGQKRRALQIGIARMLVREHSDASVPADAGAAAWVSAKKATRDAVAGNVAYDADDFAGGVNAVDSSRPFEVGAQYRVAVKAELATPEVGAIMVFDKDGQTTGGRVTAVNGSTVTYEVISLVQQLVPTGDRVGEPVGAQLDFLEDALFSTECGQPTAVVGITGSGKTMLVRYLAHMTNNPLLEQAYHADMVEADIAGKTVLDEGEVRFQQSPLDVALQLGLWYCGDELLTLQNKTRETINPVTEGSEFQRPSRPPVTIKRKDWHEAFRMWFTTNGDDIRPEGFSGPEGSRLTIIGIREPRGFDELFTFAQRDYAATQLGNLYVTPTSYDDTDRNAAREAILALLGKSPFASAFKHATISQDASKGFGGMFRKMAGRTRPDDETLATELATALRDPPFLTLDERGEAAVADALWQFSGEEFEGARKLLGAIVANVNEPNGAARIASMAPPGSLPLDVTAKADGSAVDGSRLVAPMEVARLVRVFDDLRTMQKDEGTSPLTPRLLSAFIKLYIDKRRTSPSASSAMRAFEMALLDKLPRSAQAAAVDKIVRAMGEITDEAAELLVPRQDRQGTWFGNIIVPYGRETPWKPSNERFPLTPARVKNLAAIAEADVIGRGRAISITDDANGESMETLREYFRINGKRPIVVTLTQKTDIEQLIEKLALTDDPNVIGGFAAEEQEIAQAIINGDPLVIRGCGSVPSDKLERLNPIADDRASLETPVSKRTIKAHKDFRMYVLRKPDAPHRYSPAFENRLITPQLSTRATDTTQESVNRAASELIENIQNRTQVSFEAARRLAGFHVCLNELLRTGKFTSALAIGSFLNRDAEAVARRLKHLQQQGAVSDEVEMLHRLVIDIYGERFDNESDREIFAALAKKFIAEKTSILSQPDPSASQHFVRFSDWSVPRDSRADRSGVPGLDAILPRIDGLDEVQSKIFAASQFNEAVQVHGDSLVAQSAVYSYARLTNTPVYEIECNEDMSDSSLFGGLVQDESGSIRKYAGMIHEANEQGAIIFLRRGSRAPSDQQMRIVERVLADNMERIKDGKIEVAQKKVRFFIETAPGDPLLDPSLAAACTRVRCEAVTKTPDLIALVSHVLEGVPGGASMAAALVGLLAEANNAIAGVSFHGRQPVRFDGQRLLFLANDIARAAKLPDADLEAIVAEAIVRHVRAPLDGLKLESTINRSVERALGQLYGHGGVLTAQSSSAIDVVTNPHLAALRKDYEQVAGVFTAALVKATAEALANAVETNDQVAVRRLLSDLPGGKIFPAAIERQVTAVLATGSGSATIPDKMHKALDGLRAAMDAVDGDVAQLEEQALDLMRGARLWDLEHRVDIVKRYDRALAMCRDNGSAFAGEAVGALGRVRERFDAAAAEKMISETRTTVEKAFAAYKSQTGGTDNVLQERSERVVERWDTVTGTPLFKAHHKLRNHLSELHTALDGLRDAYDDRGAPREEVKNLLKALRDAGETLEGIRIAEQSADLRRDVENVERGTQELVDELLGELTSIRDLRAVKEEHALLTRTARNIAEQQSYELLHITGGKVEVMRPELRTRDDLLQEATRTAENRSREQLDVERAELFIDIASKNRPREMSPADFFSGYNLIDTNRGVAEPVRSGKVTREQVAFDDGMARIDAAHAKRVAQTRDTIVDELARADKAEKERVYRERMLAEIDRVATRITTSANVMGNALLDMRSQLGGNPDPRIDAAIKQAEDALVAARDNARAWGDSFREKSRFASFGGKKDLADPMSGQVVVPDLTAVREAVNNVLTLAAASVADQLEKLPDVSKLDEHIAEAASLSDALANADTLGQLASRYAMLSTASTKQPEMSSAVTTVLARLTTDLGFAELLQRIAAFSETADTLSGRMAREAGLPTGVATLVESTMRAAQLIRQQPVRDKSTRACINALDQVLKQFEGAKSFYDKSGLPAVLLGVEQEAIALRDAFDGAQSSAKLSSLKDAGVDSLLEVLKLQSENGGADRIRAAMSNDLNMSGGSVRRADPAAVAATRVMRPSKAAGITRDTQLKIIDLSISSLTKATDAALKKSDSKSAGEARVAISTAISALRDRAVEAADLVNESRQTAATVLTAIEEQNKGSMVQRAQELVANAAEALDGVLQAKGKSYKQLRAQTLAAFELVAKARALIAPSELFAMELAASLTKVCDDAEHLATTFEQGAFEHAALEAAAASLITVKEAQYALAEVAAKDSKSRSNGNVAARLNEMKSCVDALTAADGDTLTAYSRSIVLESWARRLENLAPALAQDVAVTASGIAERARKASVGLIARSPNAMAERSLSEALATFAEVAQHLTASTSVGMEQAEAFAKQAEVVHKLCLSGSHTRDQALDLVQQACDGIAPFLALDSKSGGDSARDFEVHARGFRGEILRADVQYLVDGLGRGAGLYMSQTMQLAASVEASATQFAQYDPTQSLSVESLAQALRTAIQDANEASSGALVGALGVAMVHAFDAIDDARTRSGVSGEADKLAKDLHGMRKTADGLAALSTVAARYEAMVVRTREWLDRTSTSVMNAAQLEQASAVVHAMTELATTKPSDVAKKLAAVDAKYFQGAIAALVLDAPVQQAPAATPIKQTVAVAPPIRSSLSGKTSLKDAPSAKASGAGVVTLEGEYGGAAASYQSPNDPNVAPTANADTVEGPNENPDAVTERDRFQAVNGDAPTTSLFGIIRSSDVAVQDTLAAMEGLIEKRLTVALQNGDDIPPTAFENFVASNRDLVMTIRELFRKYPCELVVMNDQSLSTGEGEGDIIKNVQAVTGLLLGSVMGGESNCGVIGMGDGLGEGNDKPVDGTVQNTDEYRVQAWVHKQMSAAMTVTAADKAFRLSGIARGDTSLIPSIQASIDQFTTKSNNKLLIVQTDAEVTDAAAVRQLMAEARDRGITLIMLGYGDAKNVSAVAGEWGEHVTSYREATTGVANLMRRALVNNNGRFRGRVQASASGIGTAFQDVALEAAGSAGPMGEMLRMNQPYAPADEPAEVFGTEGPAREISTVVNRTIYDAACRKLEAEQRAVASSASFRKCLVEAREMEARHAREGISTGLRDALTLTLPRTGGAEMERKQLSGSLLDEEQLPLYVAGLAQGIPVLRIFKRKKGTAQASGKFVVAIDNSGSQGDTEKLRANVEAAFAYADAIKAQNPGNQVAVISFGERVRLHSAFEHEWNTEAKAHVLHQLRGDEDATDDEKGIAEGAALLDMLEADVGQVIAFTDGEGMPGTHDVIKQATAKGYSVIMAGVGAENKGVLQFGQHGLFARNLSQFIQQLPNVALATWQAASRVGS